MLFIVYKCGVKMKNKLLAFIIILFPYLVQSSEIYQVSTFEALTQGVYEGDVTYAEIFRKGDFGIGTFNGTFGEMVAIDGQFYQDSANGTLRLVDPSLKSPFAIVTFFTPTFSFPLENIQKNEALYELISSNFEKKNIPYAIKIEGSFRSLHLRSYEKQEAPYKPLAEASKEQNEYDLYDVEGILVGFFFPSYFDGINLARFHFHFINKSKTIGGHVLDMDLKKGTCFLQPTDTITLQLPNTESFSNAKLNQTAK